MVGGDPLPAHVDETVLGQLVADLGPGSVEEVCAVFLADGRQRLAAIASACAAGDADAAARSAHRLRSASGFLGAAGVASMCSEIEHLAAGGRLDEVASRIEAVAAELELAAQALDALVRGRGPGAGSPER